MTVTVIDCRGYFLAAFLFRQGAARVKAASAGDMLGIRHRTRDRAQTGSPFGGIRDG